MRHPHHTNAYADTYAYTDAFAYATHTVEGHAAATLEHATPDPLLLTGRGPTYRDPATTGGDDDVLAAFLDAAHELEHGTAPARPNEEATRTQAGTPTGHVRPTTEGATPGRPANPEGARPAVEASASHGIVRSIRVPKWHESGPEGTVEADSAVRHSGAQGTSEGSSKAAPTAAPNGYLISKELVSKAKLDYVDGVLDRVPGCTEAQRYFWLHVLLSGLTRRGSMSDEMVPVASALMLERLPDCPHTTEEMWGPLADAGILGAKADYSIVGRKTREFAVPAPLVLGYVEAGADAENKKGYDLFSGKRTRSPKLAQKTLLKSDSEHLHPEFIDGVLRHFQGVRREVNRTAVERHLQLRRADHAEAEKAWVAAGSPGRNADGPDCPVRKAYVRARGVLVNDGHCYEAVQKQDWSFEYETADGDEVWSYVPAYEVQALSGRLTEKQGGMQSASRPMKGASVIGLVGDAGYVNYDVISSQLYALLQAFEEAALDTAPVRDLLEQDKADIAARIGVTVDTYKACLYALLFHAWMTRDLDRALDASPDGAIVKAILEDPTENKVGAYHRLYETMKPLQKGLGAWHEWLVTDCWEALPKTGPGYAVNDCGVTFRLGDYKEGHEQRSKMAAWYLQGKEACYVHHLTLLGPKYGYTVVANEHDGVLSDGEIPQEALDEAHALANFTHAQVITNRSAHRYGRPRPPDAPARPLRRRRPRMRPPRRPRPRG